MAMPTNAQEVGVIRLLVEPGHDFKVRVDGGLLVERRELELTSGSHHISVWAPGHLMKDTTLMVVKEVRQDVVLRLMVDPMRTRYEQDLMVHKRRSRLAMIVPIATIAMAVQTGSALFNYNKEVAAYNDLKGTYSDLTITTEIDRLRSVTIPESEDAMDKYRQRLTVGAVSTTVLAGLSTFVLVRHLRRPAPVLDERERLRFEGVAYAPDPVLGTWSFHFQFRLP